MNRAKKPVNYNQSGARERGVHMLASAVARLVNRCTCMDAEMRVRFMARLLENLADDDASKTPPANFSLQAVITANPDDQEKAVGTAAALLVHNLRSDQGLNDQYLYRFYDELFAMLIPSQMHARAA